MTKTIPRLSSFIIVFVFFVSGCAWSPEARKARHLQRGDRYFGEQKYREAIIEYKNVIQIDHYNIRALQQLGYAHYALGEISQAFPYFLKAKDLDPEGLAVRLRLGTIYSLGGKHEQARQEVEFVLQKEPKNFNAHLLSASLANEPEEVGHAIQRLKSIHNDYKDRIDYYLALGALHVKDRNLVNAEESFREALAINNDSVEAHLMIAELFLMRKDLSQAENEFRMAVTMAPPASPALIKLADFHLITGRTDEAKRILKEATEKTPDFIRAFLKLAEISLFEKHYDECLGFLQPVFAIKSSDPDGLMIRGRVHLAKHETSDAIHDFEELARIQPRNPGVRYHLALANLQEEKLEKAKSNLRDAVEIAPEFTEALILQAELEIRNGSFERAIDSMERLIQKQPRLATAYILHGSACMAMGQTSRAADSYRKVVQLSPKDPRGPFLLGVALRSMGKKDEAINLFEEAIALSPAFSEPLAQLVSIYFSDKKPDAALERVSRQIKLAPNAVGLRYLVGQVHVARKEMPQAEAAFRKCIEMNSQIPGPYLALGKLYVLSKDLDKALAEFDQALKVNPKNLQAMMLSGVIFQTKGDIPKAMAAYEKLLTTNPHFAPAANNLAYLYAENGTDIAKALDLAYKARAEASDDPQIADTLGWILYKSGKIEMALASLQLSASKLPNNAEVQYHLGMTHYKSGNHDAAKKALELALELSSNFPGIEEARDTLSKL